jgi:hypothetical protein
VEGSTTSGASVAMASGALTRRLLGGVAVALLAFAATYRAFGILGLGELAALIGAVAWRSASRRAR